MNTDFDPVAPRARKTYHAPELTSLGAIQSVVKIGSPGPGPDATPASNVTLMQTSGS